MGNWKFFHIHIRDGVLQTKHFLFFSWWMSFFAFSINTYLRSIFDFCLCMSCYDQGLPRFQYNVILQRHVYMAISDLSHSHTHLSKLSRDHENRFSLTRACGMTTPLTKQYLRLEVIVLNVTSIPWPENNKFLPSFEAFFAEFNSTYSSILFRIILGRYSLPAIQFYLMSLG